MIYEELPGFKGIRVGFQCVTELVNRARHVGHWRCLLQLSGPLVSGDRTAVPHVREYSKPLRQLLVTEPVHHLNDSSHNVEVFASTCVFCLSIHCLCMCFVRLCLFLMLYFNFVRTSTPCVDVPIFLFCIRYMYSWYQVWYDKRRCGFVNRHWIVLRDHFESMNPHHFLVQTRVFAYLHTEMLLLRLLTVLFFVLLCVCNWSSSSITFVCTADAKSVTINGVAVFVVDSWSSHIEVQNVSSNYKSCCSMYSRHDGTPIDIRCI